MKERELIQKLHNGDKEAAGLIIERYYVDIYRFCLYMVQSEEDAYDIAQESLLKFIKYGTFYHHQNLKGYLLMIARNLCFDYFSGINPNIHLPVPHWLWNQNEYTLVR